MVHMPAVTKVAAVPLTVQTLAVCDAKLTARPELAVAARARGVPTVCVPGVLNVIVCGCNAAALTVKLREIDVAAAQVPLPLCVA
jgi:hypothetical protein